MLLESLSPSLVAWVLFTIVVASLIHGALGFGFPFVATPLMAMATDMRTAVVTLVIPTLAVTVLNVAMTGPIVPVVRRFWVIPLASIGGSVVGTWIFIVTPGAPYTLVLALVTFAYLNLGRLGLEEIPFVQRHERLFAPIVGFAAGLFEGTVNVAVPPLIIFYLALGLAPAVMVQALSICFIVSKLTQFGMLATHGGVAPLEWLATLPIALVAMVVFVAGLRVRARGTAEAYRGWVRRALFVIALVLLLQHVHSKWVG
jgi:uncharacterized membrane protein YfcA